MLLTPSDVDKLLLSMAGLVAENIMDGVHPDLRIGASTEIIAGEGRILTAGAIDCHVHLITPTILDEALATGVTTVIGGGTGPTEGTRATTCGAKVLDTLMLLGLRPPAAPGTWALHGAGAVRAYPAASCAEADAAAREIVADWRALAAAPRAALMVGA